MKKLLIYVHGKGGSASEAEHYKPLFTNFDVVGLDYKSQNPWEATEEFPILFREASMGYDEVQIVANSIGAFFSMMAPGNFSKAYFISPIVDMEKLILNMMMWAGVSENDLRERGEIKTDFGETLSWKYLCFVRENPIVWNVPTHVLYGSKDYLTDLETVGKFVGIAVGASSEKNEMSRTLSVMDGGEHWFHTDKQMAFLDNWIVECQK